MNFYKHYLGDYQRDTGHLSLVEHGAYRLMLDTHYATEKPLPADRAALCRLLRAISPEEQAAVESVLEQFWQETGDGYTNERAMKEITKASTQAETNRRIAEEREAKRKKTKSKDEPETNRSTNRSTNDEPNQTPDTREGSVPSERAPPIDPVKALFDQCVGLLTESGVTEKQARSLTGKWRKDYGDVATARAVRLASAEAATEPVAYIEATLKRGGKNGKRSAAEQEHDDRIAILDALGIEHGDSMAGELGGGATGVPGDAPAGDHIADHGLDSENGGGDGPGDPGGIRGGDGPATPIREGVRVAAGGFERGDEDVPGSPERSAGGPNGSGNGADDQEPQVPRPAEAIGNQGTGGGRSGAAKDAAATGPASDEDLTDLPPFLRRKVAG